MLPRIANALLALGLLVGSTWADESPGSKTSPPKKTRSVVYRVEYKKPSSSSWVTRASYREESAARAELSKLYEAGHDVRITKAETVTVLRTQSGRVTDDPQPTPKKTDTKKKPVPTPADLVVGGITVVSPGRIEQLFRVLAGRQDIAFRYPTDGCYARAHLMGVQMQQMGLKPGKAWAFDDQAFVDRAAQPRLVALTDAHPRGYVSWKYHVAPVLKVRESNGQIVTYVIDPSLHRSAVPLTVWQKRMMHPRIGFTPRLDITTWGQPPRDGNGQRLPGSGYWPGADPGELTAEARRTMVMYKPHQGTDWVPGRRTEIARRDGSKPETMSDFRAIPAREFTQKAKLDLPK